MARFKIDKCINCERIIENFRRPNCKFCFECGTAVKRGGSCRARKLKDIQERITRKGGYDEKNISIFRN